MSQPIGPLPVRGRVQHYAWGDERFLPELLGLAPDGRPWAELWLGTHPGGPSELTDGTPLAARTGVLPYLLKVLAAARPLSLQAHPDATQARAGFEAGRYVDDQPKAELLCAVTEFEAFCGFRPVAATLALLDAVGAHELAVVVRSDGLRSAVEQLYRGSIDATTVVRVCADAPEPEAGWVRTLADTYPGDPSVAVTLLLNHVVLRPGEAIRLTAGNLHAYLRGAGIELMQASDNVVRGGLTTKPVDVDDLLAIVDIEPLADPVVAPSDRYDLPGTRCGLVRLDAGATHVARSHELAVGLDGSTVYLPPGTPLVATTTTFVAVTTP